MELDCHDARDQQLIKSVQDTFSALRSVSGSHVLEVGTLDVAIALFRGGLVTDERCIHASSTGVATGKNEYGRAGVIPHSWAPLPKTKIDLSVPGVPGPGKPQASSTPSTSSTNALGYEPQWELVWESKGLSERDLCIPKGETTNPTGSMLLKAGLWTDIDFQRYFRNTVFNQLNWRNDRAKRHLHLAEARFEIRIGGISHGVFRLEIRHNSDETSRSFEQKNAMTGLRWGRAKAIIARDDLLGRTLRLFRAPAEKDLFLIEID